MKNDHRLDLFASILLTLGIAAGCGADADDVSLQDDTAAGDTDDGRDDDDTGEEDDDTAEEDDDQDDDTGEDDDDQDDDTGEEEEEEEEEEDDDDDDEPYAVPDHDAASNPGLHVQFRNTSPGPVWVDQALFNEDAPIDTRGVQYRKALSNPGDDGDWLAFRLVHGQGNSTSISLELECSTEEEESPIRARLYDDEGDVMETLVCGQATNVSLPNLGGSGDYLVGIEARFDEPFATDYQLSINGFCFQACNYQPYGE